MPISLKYTPRPQQQEILDFFAEQIKNKKKYILIDAPTGVGKSFAALMMMDWYQKNINSISNFDIITNSKILQTQYVTDFPEISSLWGKNNYECNSWGCSCEEGKLISKTLKTQCEDCPWREAFDDYKHNEISLTNFHMHARWAQFVPALLELRDSDILFVDEAHLFEEFITDLIKVEISEATINRFDIPTPKKRELISQLEKAKKEEEVIAIIGSFQKALATLLNQLSKQLLDTENEQKKIKLAKDWKKVDGLNCQYNYFTQRYAADPGNWSHEREKVEFKKKTRIKHVFKPIWGHNYIRELVWDKYDHVVFMSATILDKKLFEFLNGLEEENTAHLQLDCPFDPANRPIHFKRVGKMSYKEKHETWNKLIPILEEILEMNENVKGIIHTGNYEIASWIERDIKDSRLIFHETATRDEALETHLASNMPTVLVSPSMMNGIDLKDDLSRFQVILKVPYPNLSSETIKKRLNYNDQWYQWKTACDLIQSYGRSIRSDTDWAKTYILDANFANLAHRYKHAFPKYFKEAFIGY